MFIPQYNINFTHQTSYFQQISLNICSWNYHAMASTKQKDDVTIQMKRCAKACVLVLYSASLILLFLCEYFYLKLLLMVNISKGPADVILENFALTLTYNLKFFQLAFSCFIAPNI